MRLFLVFLLLSLCVSSAGAAPVKLILDTDIGNDIDDTLALAMIHALENRGEVQLLAVTITKDNRFAAPFVDLINTFYGRPEIPVGVVRQGKTPDAAGMIQIPAERRGPDGNYLYPHRITDGSQAVDAVQLLRRVLEEQTDQSVTIAQIGFSTNLARLLQSPGGSALIARKVKLLVLMAGNFAEGSPEYNVFIDADAARLLTAEWPTPMIFSGFEIGNMITFPYEAIEKDFRYVANHPVVDSYRAYMKRRYDRANWDSTAVLEAIRPDRGYFDLSEPGRVTVTGAKAVTEFTPDARGKCRYLIAKPGEIARIRDVIATLVSEPPQKK